MGLPLLLVKPIFQCRDKNGSYYTCTEEEACASGNFQLQMPNNDMSIPTEFHLYCEDNYVGSWVGSVYFAGKQIAIVQ